jgi:hypothetical protein
MPKSEKKMDPGSEAGMTVWVRAVIIALSPWT